MWSPYGPQWPTQGPQQGVVYIPMPVPTDTKKNNGKSPSMKKIIRDVIETQRAFEEFQKTGKKPDEKKDDKPKVPMYTFGTMVLAIFAASPFLGLGMLLIFKQMAAAIIH